MDTLQGMRKKTSETDRRTSSQLRAAHIRGVFVSAIFTAAKGLT